MASSSAAAVSKRHLLSAGQRITAPRRSSLTATTYQRLGLPSPVVGLVRFRSSCCVLPSSSSSTASLSKSSWRENLLRSSSVASPLAGQYQLLSTQTDKIPIQPKDDENAVKTMTKEEEFETSDPSMLTWVDHYLPPSLQPYARLARIDKPIGTWLLLWPCCFSTAVAAEAGHLPDPYLITLFAVGSTVMRGAGCTINDLWDRNYDAQVARCKTRPLAAGDVTVPQALGFLSLQMSTGLAVLLSLPHTYYCFQWGVASLPLVVMYPTMKRFFPYPQLVLGLCFNWGAWMGWAATYGTMDFGVIAPLYLSCVSWTLVYDTLYGHQDKDDDAKLGLQSTALTFGKDEAVQKQIMYSLATATGLSLQYLGHAADLASIYNVGALAAYGHLMWQIRTADLNDPHNLAERFRSNHLVGALLFGSMAAGKFMA